MSAILGIFDLHEPVPGDSIARRMLARMSVRGAEGTAIGRSVGAVLGVARHGWESAAGLSGDALVVDDGPVMVVADAALYYLDDLARRLRAVGVRPAGSTPGHYIAAAYRAWGDRCADHLEGDYAFLVWDRSQRRLFAARDFYGSRPLFYATIGTTLVVASTIGGVLAHPRCPGELNLTSIAEAAAGLFAEPVETPYRAVRRFPAAHALLLGQARRTPEIRRVWTPPTFVGEGRVRTSFDAAAEELRDLLARATAERMSPQGVTTVSMSGGWDSPAVFGAGQLALQRAGEPGARLRPVSMSFPVGDVGREDELIQAIAAHWSADVRWLDIQDVPFFERVTERAAERDEPFAHAFEHFNRVLARAGRDAGARVMLNGNGGDQLFQVHTIYLSEMLARGDLAGLAREWRAIGGGGLRDFFKSAVQPLLSDELMDVLVRVRGGQRPPLYYEKTLPSWISADFAARHDLEGRQRAGEPPRVVRGAAGHEKYRYLTHAFYPRVESVASELSLSEGVEERAPLFDARVVAFAATRPRTERRAGMETKRLLRAAMRGLLPDHVLAPRAQRTGTMADYLSRSLQQGFRALADKYLSTSVLGELGIVDQRRLLRATHRLDEQVQLFYTLQTELWLRSHLGRTTEHEAQVDRPGLPRISA
jgi:asparagine synthase (glutamine-hydrolysing)